MKIDVLTLFPAMLDGFLSESIVGRAQESKLIDVTMRNVRDWATDKHRVTDDRPFGGGAGMVMRCEPVFAAMEAVQTPGCRRIYLTPDGAPFTAAKAEALSKESHLVLLSGHYEGIDQRIRDNIIDEEISIGDYVLTNGTLAAAVVIDALARFIPGVLGDEKSLTHESFTRKLLDFPQYTRPAEYRGMSIPEVLLSGNHTRLRSGERRDKRRKPVRLDQIYSIKLYHYEADYQRDHRCST